MTNHEQSSSSEPAEILAKYHFQAIEPKYAEGMEKRRLAAFNLLYEVCESSGLAIESADEIVHKILSSNFDPREFNEEEWINHLRQAPLRMLGNNVPSIDKGTLDVSFMTQAFELAMPDRSVHMACCSDQVAGPCKNKTDCPAILARKVCEDMLFTLYIAFEMQAKPETAVAITELQRRALDYGLYTSLEMIDHTRRWKDEAEYFAQEVESLLPPS